MESNKKRSICGVWADSQGMIHLATVNESGGRDYSQETMNPFVWASTVPELADCSFSCEALKGDAPLNQRVDFESTDDYSVFLKRRDKGISIEHVRPLEHQYLLKNELRLFEGIRFDQIRRCQLDIETDCSVDGGFSDATRKEDRILAIGLQQGSEQALIVLKEKTDAAERELLEAFNQKIQAFDPDIIEGHNVFKFDLDYLKKRCKRLKVPSAWGRFGQNASFRNSRVRIAERWIDYPRCDIPGRTVFDTYIMVQLFDITTRDLPSYTLKNVAIYFGVTDEKKGERTYIEGSAIKKIFSEDRARFLAYLVDDLRETKGVADVLLPTYVAQGQNFPMLLQENCLRGTATKVELVFLEKYYHARQSLPEPSEVSGFEGGYTKSFETGVFQNVLHFDVASLYPSLLMLLDRNPEKDSLAIFIPMLKRLREYRLKYKDLARTTEDEVLYQEYQARQTSFKILINSFYGYLGFGGARFADSDLASEVTKRGRELLQTLISGFQREGSVVLEADTDGIYLSPQNIEAFNQPETLLAKVGSLLPEGIELEYDGSYTSMFCYKAKNYALYDGKKVLIRGAALKSRGMERYLKELTNHLIHFLLGVTEQSPMELIRSMRKAIETLEFPVEQLAKREYLSQSPLKYEEAVAAGGKSRRASLEVALKMNPIPKIGEQVVYYITAGNKKRTPDWQVARPLSSYNSKSLPYDPFYYLQKIDDWLKRYADFIQSEDERVQGELF